MNTESSAAEKHLAISRRLIQSALFNEQRRAPHVKPIAYLPDWIRLGLQLLQPRSTASKAGWHVLQIMVQLLKPIADKRPLALVTLALIAGAVLVKSNAWRRLMTPLALQAGIILLFKKLSSTQGEDGVD